MFVDSCRFKIEDLAGTLVSFPQRSVGTSLPRADPVSALPVGHTFAHGTDKPAV